MINENQKIEFEAIAKGGYLTSEGKLRIKIFHDCEGYEEIERVLDSFGYGKRKKRKHTIWSDNKVAYIQKYIPVGEKYGFYKVEDLKDRKSYIDKFQNKEITKRFLGGIEESSLEVIAESIKTYGELQHIGNNYIIKIHLPRQLRDILDIDTSVFSIFSDYPSRYLLQGRKAQELINFLHQKGLLDKSIDFKKECEE